jgi:hypothetical protein
MHDIELSTTTDVASRPEFADRKKTVTFDSNRVEEGWLVNGPEPVTFFATPIQKTETGLLFPSF